MYDKYRTFDSSLKNQLPAVFDDPYLATLKKEYTGYATMSTMDLIKHIYNNYACISLTDIAANNERL